MKLFIANLILIVLIACKCSAQSCTNYYHASEIELQGGAAITYANAQHQRTTGLELGGVWWSSLHYGPGLHATVNDIVKPNSLLFDTTQVDYNLRWPIWKFAPGLQLGIGQNFDNGSHYTQVAANVEYRFTRNFGAFIQTGYKFSQSDDTGFNGFGAVTFSF